MLANNTGGCITSLALDAHTTCMPDLQMFWFQDSHTAATHLQAHFDRQAPLCVRHKTHPARHGLRYAVCYLQQQAPVLKEGVAVRRLINAGRDMPGQPVLVADVGRRLLHCTKVTTGEAAVY